MFVGDSLASIFGFKMCLIYVIKYFPEMEQEWLLIHWHTVANDSDEVEK